MYKRNYTEGVVITPPWYHKGLYNHSSQSHVDHWVYEAIVRFKREENRPDTRLVLCDSSLNVERLESIQLDWDHRFKLYKHVQLRPTYSNESDASNEFLILPVVSFAEDNDEVLSAVRVLPRPLPSVSTVKRPRPHTSHLLARRAQDRAPAHA